MLVVVAILALLAAITVPTFFSARERARMTACTSNLRQIGMAIQMYATDWEAEPLWFYSLGSYLGSDQILLCRDDPSRGQRVDPDDRFLPYRDPWVRCSYLYEFNPLLFPLDLLGPDFPNQPPGLTWRQVKMWDLQIYGEITPLVRCFWHTETTGGGEMILNLAHDGHVYRHPEAVSWTTRK
jgi:hypothetical protein